MEALRNSARKKLRGRSSKPPAPWEATTGSGRNGWQSKSGGYGHSLNYKDGIADVEAVQDIVEKVLIENGHAKTAKAYILYREKRKSPGNPMRLSERP